MRARIVSAARIGEFPASSLSRWLNGTAPGWLRATELLRETAHYNGESSWSHYAKHLIEVATSEGDDRVNRGAFSRGWAIGTAGWRAALARDYQHLALAPEMSAAEISELKSTRWNQALSAALAASGRTSADLENAPKGAEWKIALARDLRATVAPPYRWIATRLFMGKPASVRVYLSRKN